MQCKLNYYNEFDPFAARWLRELIKSGLIPNGIVDERSIIDVRPEDLKEFTQCHFFAGIGGWSLALKLASWPEHRPVWTGSCPCQPFSGAGKKKGKSDERHLWPVWLNLIRECRPSTIFGEQVAAAITHGWLDDIYQGLEAEGYAVGSVVLPACSVGAPHKRDRLWFVAHAEIGRSITTGGGHGFERNSGIMAISDDKGLQGYTEYGENVGEPRRKHPQSGGSTWASGVWIGCPDGKQRLVEPSIRLLANGIPSRVGKLRGFGNAIAPQVAAELIKAYSSQY